MDHHYDYKKFAILYVDDEKSSLESFQAGFDDEFRIFTANSAKEGLQILQQQKEEISILMTDQRMPGESGVWLLEKCRQLDPHILRILVTAFADIKDAIAAVNTGAIYKYVQKPWDPDELTTHLKRGIEFFLVQKERDELLLEKMSVLHNMMVADRIVSLGLLAAGLNHHIRNALQAVQTFVDLAPAKMEQERGDSQALRNPEFWKEYYRTARSQIAKINTLLKDLRTASERSTTDFSQQVKVDEVLAQNVEQLKDGFAAKKIQVSVRIPASLPPLRVDGPKFARMFELLLRDEVDSLPAGSRIQISADLEPDGQHIRIDVSDDGPGLPREALRLVYDPFVAKDSAPLEYGIHLMACCFIVHHHGGQIEARSDEGKGTHFTIRLPLNPTLNQSAAYNEEDFLEKAGINNKLWENLTSE